METTKPTVSIFIPVYNAERYIQQAIESVLTQTYSNYELIIINDASTDNTAEIINRYQGYPQVKIYHNPTNLGVTGNWNHGLSLCRGEFIIRLDADDFYAPLYLEKVVSLFKQHPELGMVFTGVNLTYADGQIKEELPYKESWVRPGLTFLPEILRFCPIRAPSVCLTRRCYERIGMILAKLKIHHDWELWVRVALNNHYIGYIAEPLTYYRLLNPNGCTNQAIINAQSPTDCDYWLNQLAVGNLAYHLRPNELALLKQGMYDLVMTFAVLAMENGLTASVQKHLDFAQKILPPPSKNSMQARLYTRGAEMYFMAGENHFKAWRFLLHSLKFGIPPRENRRNLKLWARAFFGKTIFEFVREHTIARRKFPSS